jgi:O-acetylhomoserine/O-acetylserine sulfhydrylase-like pyridoxal-dependent enzyme
MLVASDSCFALLLLSPHAGACYLYGRSWSPTVHTLGRQLAALEDTEAAYAVASGVLLRPTEAA